MPDTVELLTWSGCPSHEDARRLLDDLLVELDRTDVDVVVTWVETDDAARDARFTGSPTFRIDGHDLVAPASDDGYGLTCRVYRTRAGRFSPLPDRADLLEGLRAAL